MNFLVLPVSGPYFVYQAVVMSVVVELVDSEEIRKPSLIMSSSGGGIVAYVTVASQWKIEKYLDNLRHFAVADIIQPTYPMMNMLLSLCTKKEFYQHNQSAVNGVVERMGSTRSLFRETEILFGTQCFTRSIPCVFTTSSSPKIPGTTKISDMSTLPRVLEATSAIPAVISSVDINGMLYRDGGIVSPSPFSTHFSSTIGMTHGIYVSGIDNEYTNDDPGLVSSYRFLLFSASKIEQLAFINNFHIEYPCAVFEKFDADRDGLRDALRRFNQADAGRIIITYNPDKETPALVNVSSADIFEILQSNRDIYTIRMSLFIRSI